MRIIHLIASAFLLFAANIFANQSDVTVSEFPVLKAAMNSMVEVFIELVQHAGPIGTAVGMTMIVLRELSSAVQEDKTAVQQINYEGLGERMDALKSSVDHLMNEVKFQTLIEYQSELNAEFDHFRQIILAFGSDKRKQYQELTKFIDDYKSKNIENKIANYLNEASTPSKSLRSTLVNFASASKNITECHIRSSPNKLVYDFHVATLLSIYKGNMLLLSCYAFQDQLSRGNDHYSSFYSSDIDDASFSTDENFENNRRFVNLRNAEALRKIMTSMKASLPLVNDQSDLISYNNLQSPVKVDFKNVLQLFLEFNTNLRTRGKKIWFIYTTWNCEEIDDENFKHGDGCFGTVHSCVSTASYCMGAGLIHLAVGDASSYYYDFGRLSVSRNNRTRLRCSSVALIFPGRS